MRIAIPPTHGGTDTEAARSDDGGAQDDERSRETSAGPSDDGQQANEEDDGVQSQDGRTSTEEDGSLDAPDRWLQPEKAPLDPDHLSDPTESPDTDGLFRRVGGAVFGGSSPRAGTASGSSTRWKRLLVVGVGPTEHTYEIGMQDGGKIRKANHAGSNDSEIRTAAGNRAVEGSLWHWNADSYAYTGEIASIRADGTVAVHVPGGAFASATRLHLDGHAAGTHRYVLGTSSGDVDPVATTTESTDTDHGAGSEQRHTADRVSGEIGDWSHDSYDLGTGDPLQYIAITQGHLRVSR